MKLPRIGPDQPSESVVGFETEATIVPTLRGPHVPRSWRSGISRARRISSPRGSKGRPWTKLGGGLCAPGDVTRIGAALADALHSLHQQGVIHLDLKPSNVILRADGTAVLVDFGFAHHARYPDLLAEETRFGAGSAPYVSPEQLLGTRLDRRSDSFALGVVLVRDGDGEAPFRRAGHGRPQPVLARPPPPATLVPAIPPWMQGSSSAAWSRAPSTGTSRPRTWPSTCATRAGRPHAARDQGRAGRAARARSAVFARRAELGPRLRSPGTLLSRTPIVLVAVNTRPTSTTNGTRQSTRDLADARAQLRVPADSRPRFPVGGPARPPGAATAVDRAAGLPIQRLSLHAVPSDDPAEVIVELARHNNNVDLVVLGAPSEGGRAWPHRSPPRSPPRRGAACTSCACRNAELRGPPGGSLAVDCILLDPEVRAWF